MSAVKDVIQVSGFYKAFAGKPVHENVSFTVKSGECVGLIGGSGAGKSVLLRSLIGLERPDEGSIRIDGEEITQLDEYDLFAIRRKVAYVFQYGALFDSMSVYENLAYNLIEHTTMSDAEIASAVDDLLVQFNLKGTERLLPSELSGGMQKRVGLARAIILNPRAVLYDEPTAGLDPANTVIIQDLILQLKRTGSSGILVTHDMDTALRVCDRIYFLKNKNILDLGPADNLRRNKEQFLDLFLKDES